MEEIRRGVLVLEERPALFDHSNRLLSCGHNWPMQRLLDFYTNAGHITIRTIERSRNHGVDLLSLTDHHEDQVNKSTSASSDMS
jgi:hypothetical protein